MSKSLDDLLVEALPELTENDKEIIHYYEQIADDKPLSTDLFPNTTQLADGMTVAIILEMFKMHAEEARRHIAIKAAVLFDELWRRNIDELNSI